MADPTQRWGITKKQNAQSLLPACCLSIAKSSGLGYRATTKTKRGAKRGPAMLGKHCFLPTEEQGFGFPVVHHVSDGNDVALRCH